MDADAAELRRAAARALESRLHKPARWRPRPHQIPPEGDWYGWLLLAGRGAGKTDACAEYVARHVAGPPCLPGPVPHWIAIIAPTQGDAVTACVTGPSGIKAHDPTATMVTTAGGTVVRWPNGSQAKLFGANSPEDVERLRAGGNSCVAEGTLIRTEHGLRPIESIRPGDLVWTRNGLRRVLRTWDNGVKGVVRYDHAAGSVELTPDHKVWTEENGWTEVQFVKPTDTILTWGNTVSPSSTTVSRGYAAETATTETSTGACSTVTSGSSTTVRYPTGCTSITRTTTRAITTSATSLWSLQPSITPTTNATRSGTARAVTLLGPTPGTGTTSASAAGRVSGPGGLKTWSGTAPRLVATMRHEHGKNGCAACAANGTSARLVYRPAPVRAGALRSTPTSSVAHVYDLTVEHDHEFFAGDLLVSNCLAWNEELAAWRHLDDAFDQLRFGLRSGPRPHWIASTTPKPKPLIRRLDAGEIRGVVTTHATMYDNPHLPEHIKAALEDSYGGTQLGRQELYGRLIDEDENALWSRSLIDSTRLRPGDVPELSRITVGVDPSGGAGEQGIVVVGKSHPLPGGARPMVHGYVLADVSGKFKPEGWGARAVQAAVDWDADDIVVERNYGGDMAVSTIAAAAQAMGVDIPIRTVVATRGKAVRAQPVAALAAQGRWHHVGEFEALETQMTTWYPEIGWSPDRLDAAVWGAWHTKLVGASLVGHGKTGLALAGRRIA